MSRWGILNRQIMFSHRNFSTLFWVIAATASNSTHFVKYSQATIRNFFVLWPVGKVPEYQAPIGWMAKGPQNYRALPEVGVLFWWTFGIYHISEQNWLSLSSLLVNSIPALVLYKRGIGHPYVGHKCLREFLSRHIGLPPVLDTGGRGGWMTFCITHPLWEYIWRLRFLTLLIRTRM